MLLIFSNFTYAKSPLIHGVPVFDAVGPIKIDGKLNEASWQNAVSVNEFLRFQPAEGGPPPGKTDVRFMQNEKYLFVGIRVSELDYKPNGRVSPREQINDDDLI